MGTTRGWAGAVRPGCNACGFGQSEPAAPFRAALSPLLSYNVHVGFEVIEHTADIGIVAHGEGLGEAFASAALGLFSLITDLETVREVTSRELVLQARDPEGLLVEWLNGLIYLFDVENLLLSRFEFQEFQPTRLVARAYGEKADLSRHPIKIGVKAATHHMLKVEKGDGYRVQVLFDI